LSSTPVGDSSVDVETVVTVDPPVHPLGDFRQVHHVARAW